MHVAMEDARQLLRDRLETAGVSCADDIAWATVWLEACGYSGFKLLGEALADEQRDLALVRDILGFDLKNVSCVFLASAIIADVKANGRVFLRNVRHGLLLLPYTVRDGLGIGCPVDPSFAVGGERLKDPYAEKLALAAEAGLELDDAAWAALNGS